MANYKLASLSGEGGNRNQASRGGGPWRLIGNGPPVNVNGNQGFVQLWLTLYTDPSTQDKLSPAVTLLAPLPHPLHLHWKGERTGTKEAKKNGVVRQRWNTKGEKKRGMFDISNLPVCSCLGALVMIWKGAGRRTNTKRSNFPCRDQSPCESHHEGHFLTFSFAFPSLSTVHDSITHVLLFDNTADEVI